MHEGLQDDNHVPLDEARTRVGAGREAAGVGGRGVVERGGADGAGVCWPLAAGRGLAREVVHAQDLEDLQRVTAVACDGGGMS